MATPLCYIGHAPRRVLVCNLLAFPPLSLPSFYPFHLSHLSFLHPRSALPTLPALLPSPHRSSPSTLLPSSIQARPSSTPSSTRALTSATPTLEACLAQAFTSLRTRQRATSTSTVSVGALDAPPTKTAPATCATGDHAPLSSFFVLNMFTEQQTFFIYWKHSKQYQKD